MKIVIDHDDNDSIHYWQLDDTDHVSMWYRHSYRAGYKKLVAHWPLYVRYTEERVYHILHEWLQDPHVLDELDVLCSLIDANLLDRELAIKRYPYIGIPPRAEEP